MLPAPRLPLVLSLLALANAGIAGCGQTSPQPVQRVFDSDESSSLNTIAGQVRDGRSPAPGVRVRYKASADSVVTDADGRFQLPPLPSASARVVAWKQGYFIAGERADATPLALTLKPLPSEDCERYNWVDPAPDPSRRHACANCHEEIYREWTASAHSRSATGRHFRNLYEGSDWHGRRGVGWSLLAENADGAGVCSSCHAPTINSFNDPGFTDLRKMSGVAAKGVHCDFCHKISDAPADNLGLTHGRFGLKLLRPEEGQLFFGPLDDVDRGDDAFSPLYRQSRYCASCHEGTVLGVHVYSTYSEWLESPARRAGKQCQSCHMAPTGRLTNLAPGKGGIPRDARTLGNHRFFAGSQADMLREAVKLAVTLKSEPSGLRAEVEVRADGAGHRVPTGFVDRNLVLMVQALDRAGKPITASSGPSLPPAAGTSVAGQPGRLYAKLLSDFDGYSPVPFWRARPEVVDTRLIPGQADRLTIGFPAGAERVRVRLIHRRFWPEQAAIKGWPDNEIMLVDHTVAVQNGREIHWSGP
jgi:hypothetical protein